MTDARAQARSVARPGPRPSPAASDGHLLGLIGMPEARICALLDAAARYEPVACRPETDTGELAGRTVANLFFEDSTRTRVSFSLAAQRLGARTVDLASGSSVSKGETIADTARTVESMGISAIVVRARPVGAASIVAGAVRCPVINAGDGTHEHPTQALIDAYALAEAHARTPGWDLSGLRVAIVGDIAHSRVARSGIACLGSLGARVVCVGPPGLVPAPLAELGCTTAHDLDRELASLDAIMMLRMQFERHAPGAGSTAAFASGYALTAERAERLKPGAVVLHPGPFNRGLEIACSVAEGPRSLIRRQVELGVAVRMGVLRTVLGG